MVFDERIAMSKILNFGKFPVIPIDLDSVDPEKKMYGQVRVAWDKPGKEGMSSRCDLCMYEDKFSLMGNAAILKSNYTINDFIEDVQFANTPLVHKGELVALAIYSEKLKVRLVDIRKVSNRIDVHCMVIATLEDLTKEDKETVKEIFQSI